MAVAAVQGAASVAGVVSDITQEIASFTASPTAPTNEAENAWLAQRAVQGDSQALVNLATVSGQAGQAAGISGAGVPTASTSGLQAAFPSLGPTLLGGWGSAAAQADAVAKYQAVVSYLQTRPTSTLASLGSNTTVLVLGGLLLVGFLFLVSRK